MPTKRLCTDPPQPPSCAVSDGSLKDCTSSKSSPQDSQAYWYVGTVVPPRGSWLALSGVEC